MPSENAVAYEIVSAVFPIDGNPANGTVFTCPPNESGSWRLSTVIQPPLPFGVYLGDGKIMVFEE